MGPTTSPSPDRDLPHAATAGSDLCAAAAGVPRVVLDTNAVLDWLYFRDPRCASLDAAIAGGRVRWIASEAMRAEAFDVVARGNLGTKWPGGADAVREGWRRWAAIVAEPTVAPAPLRCSDADDQKFIDLAVAARAAALLSADRAVLRLARGARAWGVAITTVDRWAGVPAA